MKALAITWNPALQLPEAVALAFLFVATGLWLAWRASRGAPALSRCAIISLRTLALTLLALLWLNPGRWRQETEQFRRSWLVLLDRSASMRTEQDQNRSRWSAGLQVVQQIRKDAPRDDDVRVRTFSNQLEDELSPEVERSPDGAGTNLHRALTAALNERIDALAGIVVISDGRETAAGDLESVALRARGRGIPIHVLPLGNGWGSRDLLLTAVPRQVLAFRDQPVKLAARVENRGLGNIKPEIILTGPDGRELGRKAVALVDGARETVTFEIDSAPAGGGNYTLHTAVRAEEHLPANNSETVRVNVLDSKIRVLLLEGAPYWDSKFLAQLLRRQQAVDIRTIHRLNEERYFRVETSGAEPLLSPQDIFPESSEALARYDLVVFGKGAGGFLNQKRIAILRGFVRDQGGALLFARGKPYAGRFPALESLEPVEWGESQSGSFHIIPLADATAGLFGAALPGGDDTLWQALPPLDDVREITRLKPFARVIAEAQPDGRQSRTPLLVARRFGRGMVATVNADGLWRWDFRPDVASRGDVYQQFWVQLMQWCATYSEFRPGEDYAVRLREPVTMPGQPVRAVVAWRGVEKPEPQPFLKIYKSGAFVGEATATALPMAEGGREWAAVLTLDEPGRYEVRVADKARAREQGEAVLQVDAPPGERDDLRPDPETLATLARISGGKSFTLEQAEKLSLRAGEQPIAAREKAEWEPLWPRWWVAVLGCMVFGSEWWLRRREGLL